VANVRFIPIDVGQSTQEDLAVANSSTVTFPQDSMWVVNSEGDLTVSSVIAGRMGSWVSRFNLNSLDTPPLIEWKYAPGQDNDAQVVLQNEASRAHLRVSNLDIQPRPQAVYPDTYWVRNGLDITPRSSS
jgi:hypothetical protein